MAGYMVISLNKCLWISFNQLTYGFKQSPLHFLRKSFLLVYVAKDKPWGGGVN